MHVRYFAGGRQGHGIMELRIRLQGWLTAVVVLLFCLSGASASFAQTQAQVGVGAGGVVEANRQVTANRQTGHVGINPGAIDTTVTFKGATAARLPLPRGLPGIKSPSAGASYEKTVDLKNLLKRKTRTSTAAAAKPAKPSAVPAKVQAPVPVAALAVSMAVPETPAPVAVVKAPILPPEPTPRLSPAVISTITGVVVAVLVSVMGFVLLKTGGLASGLAAIQHAADALTGPHIHAEGRMGTSTSEPAELEVHDAEQPSGPAIGFIVRPGPVITEFAFMTDAPQEAAR